MLCLLYVVVISVTWQQEKYQGKCPLVDFITTKLFSYWIEEFILLLHLYNYI